MGFRETAGRSEVRAIEREKRGTEREMVRSDNMVDVERMNPVGVGWKKLRGEKDSPS